MMKLSEAFYHSKPCRYSFYALVAHEVATIYDKAVNFKDFTLTETDQAAADALSVSIDTDKAPYYAARILDNVTITLGPHLVCKEPHS